MAFTGAASANSVTKDAVNFRKRTANDDHFCRPPPRRFAPTARDRLTVVLRPPPTPLPPSSPLHLPGATAARPVRPRQEGPARSEPLSIRTCTYRLLNSFPRALPCLAPKPTRPTLTPPLAAEQARQAKKNPHVKKSDRDKSNSRNNTSDDVSRGHNHGASSQDSVQSGRRIGVRLSA